MLFPHKAPIAAKADVRSSAPPTLIAFFGPTPGYLPVALRSAAAFGNDVVLLGDAANRGAWRAHADSSRMTLPKLDTFRASFTKMSDYNAEYENAFWRRPFVIEEWMKAEGVQRAFVLDSDVVTFANYGTEVWPSLPADCPAGLMTLVDQAPLDWATSLHFSYWTLDALSDFTSFCIEAYRPGPIRRQLESRYRVWLDERRPGGNCEMTMLFLWRQQRASDTFNFATVWDGKTGDLAIGTASNAHVDEYPTEAGLKKFSFANGLPYAANVLARRDVRFVCVHCQGQFKPLMPFLFWRATRRWCAKAYRVNRALSTAHRNPLVQQPLSFIRRRAASIVKAAIGG